MDINKLTNKDLVDEFSILVKQEKEAIANVVLHLAEIDRRKLYLEEAYASLFEYCVKKYHYSEQAAYLRISAARLTLKFHEIFELLESGKLNLTTLKLLAPHLSTENKQELFQKAQYQSRRSVEKLLATLFPENILIEDKIRQLPTRTLIVSQTASKSPLPLDPTQVQKEAGFLGLEPALTPPVQPAAQVHIVKITRPEPSSRPAEEIKPITAKRYKIELSASEELAKKIQRAKEVLRHKYPEGKLEDILGDALDLLLEKRDPMLTGILKKMPVKKVIIKPTPRVQTRYIPKTVRLTVYQKDHGQCSYISPDGRRCEERGALEMDHVHPYALGGGNEPENLRLLCRNHNHWRAEKTFGKVV